MRSQINRLLGAATNVAMALFGLTPAHERDFRAAKVKIESVQIPWTTA